MREKKASKEVSARAGIENQLGNWERWNLCSSQQEFLIKTSWRREWWWESWSDFGHVQNGNSISLSASTMTICSQLLIFCTILSTICFLFCMSRSYTQQVFYGSYCIVSYNLSSKNHHSKTSHPVSVYKLCSFCAKKFRSSFVLVYIN